MAVVGNFVAVLVVQNFKVHIFLQRLMANMVHNSSTLITPLLSNIKGEATGNLSLLAYFASLNDNPKKDTDLKVENYLELSSDSVALSVIKEENNGSLNLEATELTLGPPRSSQFPGKDAGLELESPKIVSLDESKNPVCTPHPSTDGVCSSIKKTLVSGNKRAFSETIDEKICTSKSEASLSETSQSTSQGNNTSVTSATNVHPPRAPVQQQSTANGTSHNNNSITPTDKAEAAAGWPPVKVRKTSPAALPKNNDKVDGKHALLVKVSMNGAPYLRKVNLRSYSTYQELSLALRKMFNCFTLGTCEPQEASGTVIQGGESRLRDQKQSSKHVIAYEDKDGDWMLVGDVPWEIFIESCKKLKIMKGSEAIGFGDSPSSTMEKSKNKNSRKR